MEMYVAGEWVRSTSEKNIVDPFTGEVVDAVPNARPEDVERALVAAERGREQMRRLPGHERSAILNRVATLIEKRSEEFAQSISAEEGKPLSEARVEVARVPELLRLCAFEGTQARGETLPLDAHRGGEDKIGFTTRVPCGIAVAITPFNFPLLLVAHKVGPGLAAGNAVILKPASQTPMTALRLTEVFLEAGLPELGLQCITGAGGLIGAQICADRRVRAISFTGSTEVGESIASRAGVKKLSLELGSNSPLVVLRDADPSIVAHATSLGGYANAGQVCISTQRVIVVDELYEDVVDELGSAVSRIVSGNQFDEQTTMGPMISEGEGVRVGEWIAEAVDDGARVVTGNDRNGALFAPTVVADVGLETRLWRDELFGPAVAVARASDAAEAVVMANQTSYGLSAGVFTRDLESALAFAMDVDSGNVHINWSPQWRADFMPYGGLKASGIGKEGPRYAIEALTETKTIVLHRRSELHR